MTDQLAPALGRAVREGATLFSGTPSPSGTTADLSLVWRDVGTSSIGTGEMTVAVSPIPVVDIPDLRIEHTLQRPYITELFRSPVYVSTMGGVPRLVKSVLAGTVHGQTVQIPLGPEDLSALRADSDGAWESLSTRGARLFRFRYATCKRPQLFDGLTPADPHVLSARSLFVSLSPTTATPGMLFPPDVMDPEPWRTVTDQPTIEFFPLPWDPSSSQWCPVPDGTDQCQAAWVWRDHPGAGVTASAAWHDLDAIEQLVQMVRDPELGRMFTWALENAVDDIRS